MSRQQLTGPLSVVLAGLIVIVLLLAGSSASASVRPGHGTPIPTWTPCPSAVANQTCNELHENATLTAEALTETAYPAGTPTTPPYPSPTGGTSVGTATSSATTTSQAQAGTGTPTTGTATLTQTQTLTQTRVARTPSFTPLPATAAPEEPAAEEPTATPADALTCAPGVPIEITGAGPPRAPLLLYFGDRPVGGGSVAPNGTFALKLMVGQERPGEYKVIVRVRGTSQALRQVTCTVPYLAPTPLPAAEP